MLWNKFFFFFFFFFFFDLLFVRFLLLFLLRSFVTYLTCHGTVLHAARVPQSSMTGNIVYYIYKVRSVVAMVISRVWLGGVAVWLSRGGGDCWWLWQDAHLEETASVLRLQYLEMLFIASPGTKWLAAGVRGILAASSAAAPFSPEHSTCPGGNSRSGWGVSHGEKSPSPLPPLTNAPWSMYELYGCIITFTSTTLQGLEWCAAFCPLRETQHKQPLTHTGSIYQQTSHM